MSLVANNFGERANAGSQNWWHENFYFIFNPGLPIEGKYMTSRFEKPGDGFENLRISEAWFEARNLKLHMPFAISKGSLDTADNVFFFIKDESGHIGLGESAPFPVLTHDTQSDVIRIANEELQKLIGKNVDEAIASTKTELRVRYFKESPTFLAGLEIALWDLRAKQMHVPLSRLFGTANLCHLSTDITLPIMPVTKVGAFWGFFKDHKFGEVKIKVGGASVAEDLDRIEAIVGELPKGTRISLDGNQGCTVSSSLELLRKLHGKDIIPDLFEQPLPEGEFYGMAELTAKSPVAICADELVKTSSDAIKAVSIRACHMINLKIMKSGLSEAWEIAIIAKSAGLGLMIGGMVETEVAMSASLHLACGTGLVDWLDLDTPFFIAERVTKNSPWQAANATLSLPSGPGLGLKWLDA